MDTHSVLEPTPSTSAEHLRPLCAGAVHLPGDPGYDAARTPWNVAVDLRPAAVAVPRDADDVVAVVHAALDAGLRVAPMSTGHAASVLGTGRLDDVVLVRLSEMTGVEVDPVSRTARVVGGTLWQDVVEAAAPHGLAALHGSSPDVAVAGYCLGGGIGWYARKHGFAANSIRAVDLVTPTGELLRLDADQHADLFWAVRGGSGNFGIVTALEIALLPIPDAYAGMLLWDAASAPQVVRAWAAWAPGAPEEVTTSCRVMRFPPLPELPDFLRGRQVVIIDGAVLASDDEASRILAPLRALAPEMDTFTRMPAAALPRIHMDPEGGAPAAADHTMLAELPEEAVEVFLAAVAAGPSLLAAELRQLGGALARRTPGGGAIGATDAAFAGFFLGIAPTPEAADAVRRDAARAVAALEPWAAGRELPTFAEHRDGTRRCYDGADWERLVALRGQVDPGRRMVAGLPIEG
jgi:FAD/FMN-containing dehydrogenase